MNTDILKIATCQFPVSGDIAWNAKKICAFIDSAASAGANIVHFSECALSGYASVDFPSHENYNWPLLRSETEKVMASVAKNKVYVVLGSAHQLTPPNLPHNSLYLIGPDGKIIDRYDKRFGTTIDMDNYAPGDHFVTFDINGIKCALLICFDLRFPEIYRELKKLGIQCILQSFYNARQKGPSVHTDIMRQTMQCRAATNYFWVSMTNSCAWYCPYPSCFIRPDGRIVEQLPEHKDSMMINTVDLSKEYYDPSAKYRDLAMQGKLTNAPSQAEDERSNDRQKL
jgi:predicted amidohydrolase